MDLVERSEASTGSTRALACCLCALTKDRPSTPFHGVSAEGIGNNTRGRVCSPRLSHLLYNFEIIFRIIGFAMHGFR
jgi:hypothetical protein